MTTPANAPTVTPRETRVRPPGWPQRVGSLVAGLRARFPQVSVLLLAGFALGALLLIGFGSIAYSVADDEALQIDLTVLVFLKTWASPQLDAVMRFISMLGSELLGIVVVILLAYLAVRRSLGTFVAVLLTVVGSQMLNDILKLYFTRPRPSPVEGVVRSQSWSFPSGHAMNSAAFYGLLAYLAWKVFHGWVRLAVATGFAVLVLAIGLSRLYLGVHYLTDVIAGYLAGLIWMLTVVLSLHLLGGRRPPSQAPTNASISSA